MSDNPGAERFSLKDHLFNRDTVAYLAELFSGADAAFPAASFIGEVMEGLAPLELKQRISFIAEVLAQYLPNDYPEAADRIEAALPSPLDPDLSDDDFGDFIIAPLGEIVATRGIAPEYRERSLDLLREITKRFSMEGPLRPFLDRYPSQTMSRLEQWAQDENYHVRRLVSEGTRPLLPWAPRINLEPGATIPLLGALHADPTRYVTRSVANHLNDLTKIDPDLATDTLSRWSGLGLQDPGELAWMTKHALRTLIKRGNRRAMELLGHSPEPEISVAPVHILNPDGKVEIGEPLRFSVAITAHRDESLVVDYVVDFVTKGGGKRSKVFKLKSCTVSAGDTVVLKKSHPLRGNATTYSLFPGEHSLTIQINGQPQTSAGFVLESGPGG